MDVKWKYTPSHQGIQGNEKADELAREGIEKELPPIFPENQEKMNAQLTDSRLMIVEVPSPGNDSNTSDSDNEQDSTNSAVPKKATRTDINKVREDLQKSFSQFDKSVMERRVNSSELGTESMLWDHEGVDDNVKLSCTHVSEGEKDQEFLEELEAPDPCEEYEDRAFSEGVQKYLQKYAESAQTERNEKDEVPKEQFSAFPPHEQKSGVARKSIVRFKDQLEEQQPPRKSWYPTPMTKYPLGAMSTPFPIKVTEQKSTINESSQRKTSMKPRCLQTDWTHSDSTPPNQTPDMRINVSVPYIDPPSPSEDFTDSFKKSKTDHNKNPNQSQNICSWNVSRIRAFLKKNGSDYINQEDPDIVALQEVKCNYTELPNEAKPEGYSHYYMEGARKGYCDVALLSKVKPININYGLENTTLEAEARVITAEFEYSS